MGINHPKHIIKLTIFFLLLISISYPITHAQPQTTTLTHQETIHITTNTTPLIQPGYPPLPQYTKTYTLPYKSTLTSLNIQFSTPTKHHLTTPLPITPHPQPLNIPKIQPPAQTTPQPSYLTYPHTNYTYTLKHGINPTTNTRTTYLIIHLYPTHHHQPTNTLTTTTHATIHYTYQPPPQPLPINHTYMHLIITSPLLEPQAQQLTTYKNHLGIPTTLINTTTINTTTNGTDLPHKIRTTITHYITHHNITYVTLFGDADQIPVRYTYIPSEPEPYTPSDLYYADIDGTWDTNNDTKYADPTNDTIDGIPDVHIGRIPASLPSSAENYVNKIKNYFTQPTTQQPWTKKHLLISGEANSGISDFGIGFTHLNNHIQNLTPTYHHTKLYEPNNTLNLTTLLTNLNNGSFFVNFVGHGAWDLWFLRWIINNTWSEDLNITHVKTLQNHNKTPLITTMSCTTARFDDKDCIGEIFTLQPTTGSIGYMGSTRTAWGYVNESITTGLMGELNWRIYDTYTKNTTQLGRLWSTPITNYVQNHSLLNEKDSLTILEFVLLGDPTLNLAPQPTQVYIDDDYTHTTPGWGYTHFKTITHGITVIAPHGTIHIHPGTYPENLTITKPLTLHATKHTNLTTNTTNTSITIQTHNVTIHNLTLTSCHTALHLINTTHTTITNTTFQYNNHAIILTNATNNKINYNNLSLNNHSITLINATNNTIHHNNFAYNTHHPTDLHTNTWHNPHTQQGNYWNTYTGIDTNHDNIGDTPQPIHGGTTQDPYPLMFPHHTTTITTLQLTPSHLTTIQNKTHQYTLTLDTLPQGFQEIALTINISNTTIATITNHTIAPWITSYTKTPLPAPTLTLTITDINNTINTSTTNILLATLNITTTHIGSTYLNQTIHYHLNDKQYPTYTKTNNSHLTVIINHPPDPPTNPIPQNGSQKQPTKVTLKINVSDPDNHPLTISFFNANTHTIIGTPQTIPSNGTVMTTWSGLKYQTTYSWYILIEDLEGGVLSDIFYFTTKKKPSSGGGGGAPPPPPDTPPTADLSAKAPYHGVINEKICFDASLSTDDQSITNYTWDFGDATKGYDIQTNHTYTIMGTYTVSLTVTDNTGQQNTDTTSVIISIPNRPPTQPIITAPISSTQNSTIEIMLYSTDPDNDTLTYNISWGDTQTTQTKYSSNGSVSTATHKWNSAGIYKITVMASDKNNASSQPTFHTILIDVFYLETIGYLLDLDSDTFYDQFFSNVSKEKTVVEFRDMTYFIDSDSDGQWDYIYSKESGIQTYVSDIQTPGFFFVMVLFAIGFYVLFRKKF